MSLLTTELACTSAPDQVLHLFFQDGQNILEARSPDGGNVWTTQDTIIAKDGDYSGSSMTCYYVDKDAGFDNQPSIHLLYMNKDKQLTEKVKRMKGDNPIWEDVKIPDEVRKGPEQYSKLTSDSFNQSSGWNPNGSQWAYFSANKDGKMGIVEIRRTPKDPWHTETVLSGKWGDELPGTALACVVGNGKIKVFLQHHDYSIVLYENQDNTWHDRGTFIPKDKVQATTPLACTMTKDGSVHLFYVSKTNMIIHCTDGKKEEELINFFPGSKLGATSVENKITLFFRNLNPVNEVGTLENDNGSWKHGTTVIPA
uniref:Developmental-specific protein Ssp1 n=1 Tax=Sclerotinia minor TaxID=38451 RepID=C5HG84_9HELO|nr:developmental-specific protein Ssp1 [Sclerotinia minor]